MYVYKVLSNSDDNIYLKKNKIVTPILDLFDLSPLQKTFVRVIYSECNLMESANMRPREIAVIRHHITDFIHIWTNDKPWPKIKGLKQF